MAKVSRHRNSQENSCMTRIGMYSPMQLMHISLFLCCNYYVIMYYHLRPLIITPPSHNVHIHCTCTCIHVHVHVLPPVHTLPTDSCHTSSHCTKDCSPRATSSRLTACSPWRSSFIWGHGARDCPRQLPHCLTWKRGCVPKDSAAAEHTETSQEESPADRALLHG